MSNDYICKDTFGFLQKVKAKNRASDKKCYNCIYYIANYKDDYTLRHFGYGEVKYRPACGYGKSYGHVLHNPAASCKYFEEEQCANQLNKE